MPGTVYATIQILSQLLAAFFVAILARNLLRGTTLRDQVLAAIAIVPLLLRALGVK